MATIVMQTVDLIKSIATWSDNVYPNIIPDEELDKTDRTIILVRSADSLLGDYGSDMFMTLSDNITVQIFYSITSDLDYDVVETKLYHDLTKNNYKINRISGRLVDIDTNQCYQTFTVTKTRTTKNLLK